MNTTSPSPSPSPWEGGPLHCTALHWAMVDGKPRTVMLDRGGVEMMCSLLGPTVSVLEYGSGGSTTFFRHPAADPYNTSCPPAAAAALVCLPNSPPAFSFRYSTSTGSFPFGTAWPLEVFLLAQHGRRLFVFRYSINVQHTCAGGSRARWPKATRPSQELEVRGAECPNI
jgi:hypothetical protein